MTAETSPAARLSPVAASPSITMDNPPVNGLGLALRRGIVDAIERANADGSVDAIVLAGSERAFSGGADVREFGTPKSAEEPNLRTVIAAVEASAKPVVAAIAGVCLGGGMELAMGCHFRVAAADAQLGLPEVKLGLLPGATGTQRLPRLIGVEKALDMIVSGAPQKAQKFAGTPLVDEVVPAGGGNVVDAAVAFAERVVAEKRPVERVRDRERAGRRGRGRPGACPRGGVARARAGAGAMRRRGGGVALDAVRRRRALRARAVRGADGQPRIARRCATSSPPSALRRRSSAWPTT